MPYPFEFQLLEEDWEHFSVLMDEAVRRIPVLADTGIRKFYNGPESFTPDNQFLLGEAPRAARLLRRRRLQLRRHRLGRRRRAGPGRVDRRGRADDGPGRGRRPPVRAVQRQQPLAAGPGRRGARPALRGAVAEPRAGDRAAVPLLAAARPARRRGRGRSGPGWAGSGPTSSRRPGRSRALDYTWGKPAWLPWSAAEQRATRQDVAVFDQTSFSKYVVDGPGRPGVRCSGSAPTTSTWRWAGWSTRRCSTAAAPTRRT